MRVFLALVMVCGIALITAILKVSIAEHARHPAAEVDLIAPGFIALIFVILPAIAIAQRSGKRGQRMAHAEGRGPRRVGALGTIVVGLLRIVLVGWIVLSIIGTVIFITMSLGDHAKVVSDTTAVVSMLLAQAFNIVIAALVLAWLRRFKIGVGVKLSNIPVCYENDVPVGSPYILPSGDRHIVRVRQVEPPECEYLEDLDGDDSFMVAGISFREDALTSLLGGTEIAVSAIREPENKKDRNAIRVEATWVSSAGRRSKGTLGYIQATAAAAIARTYADSPLECMVDVIFAPRKGMNAGMRVHLLVHETAKRTKRRKLRTA